METTSRQPGDLSPDRLWQWDGQSWIPTVSVSGLAAQPAVARRSPFGLWGGITAILGVAAILAGCILPYANFNASSSGSASSPSIFNEGYFGGIWYAAEPVAVMLVGLGAAIAVMAVTNRTVAIAASTVLMSMGLQTFLMFTGYLGSSAMQQDGHAGSGSVVGLVGALLLLIGGVLSTLGSATSRPAPAA